MELQSLSSSLRHPQTRADVIWSPPIEPSVKLNFDAGFCGTGKKSWSGHVIRNEQGEILGASYRRNEGISSAFEAEALACVQGLRFAADLGFTNIVVEGDYCSVIQKLCDTADDFSTIRPLIADAKRLALLFRSCRFAFVGRNGNRVAHAMAALGRRDQVDRFWVEDAPSSALLAADEDRRLLDPP
ncbi:hypothetical protein HRI_003205200 [Hibiscus trionum]|uniref:RNase H type-1 domain-containing protein n=1 Tax=Hibiscus trionum TaxID=183268 RepID=A0A9W7MCK9_HIBTR|nr:hypothetical protein HRI_003205200 [Hibiscus trionum]